MSVKWIIQAGNLTTHFMVNIELSLPDISVMKIVAWECHVDNSTAGRYGTIIGRDLLTNLGIDLKGSTNTIECG